MLQKCAHESKFLLAVGALVPVAVAAILACRGETGFPADPIHQVTVTTRLALASLEVEYDGGVGDEAYIVAGTFNVPIHVNLPVLRELDVRRTVRS